MKHNQTESQYDTYVGWKNRERQVMKGEHSEVNHLGERVFHIDQTKEIDRLEHRPRRRWFSTDAPWDDIDAKEYDHQDQF